MDPEELEAQKAAEAAAKAKEEADAAEAATKAKEKSDDSANAQELERLRRERDEAIAEAKRTKDQFADLDPTKAREAIKKQAEVEASLREAEKAKAEAEGNWERIRELMNEERDAREKALQAELDTERGETQTLKTRLNEMTVGQEFSASNFIREKLLLTPTKARVLYGAHVEIEDGNPVVYDKPRGEKDRTMYVDGKGRPLSFDAAIEKVVNADPDRDSLLKSTTKPGAHSKTSDGQAPSGELSRQEKIREGLRKLRS